MDKEQYFGLRSDLAEIYKEISAFRREVSITSAFLKSSLVIMNGALIAIAIKLWK